MLNKSSNKVSYLETLHPEQGFKALSKEEGSYAGKWDAVWAEAVLIDDDTNIQSNENSLERPTGEAEQTVKTDNQWNRYNFLLLTVGRAMLIAGVASTVMTELGGYIVFLAAAGFYWVSEKLRQMGGIVILFHYVFGLVYVILSFMDILLLFLGTLITELMAGIAFLLCTLFGGPAAGAEWHQSVRRLCHLTRWAFRSFHDEWNCRRGLLLTETSHTKEESHGTNDIGVEAPTSVNNDDGTIVLGVDDVVVEQDPEDSRVEAPQSKQSV